MTGPEIRREGAPPLRVRPARPSDRAGWEPLFRGYLAFYGCPVTSEVVDNAWRWNMDPGSPVSCLVAEDDAAEMVGFVQYRPVPETLVGGWFGQMDDLFVAPAARGCGVARALIDALAGIARDRGWVKLAWITAGDNAEARRLYDGLAKATDWVVYERPMEG